MIDVPRRTLDGAVDLGDGWNRPEVRHPLWEHHLRKCYLCEGLVSRSGFEVEHRVPQAKCAALKFCWLNLFPCHDGCNGRRGEYPQRGGLLSPGLDTRLEARIHQRIERLNSTEIRARFTAVNPDDLYAHNTASELERIHSPDSGTTSTAREKGQELLDEIEDRYRESVYPIELKVLRARRRGERDLISEEKLRRRIARTEPYTMLIRSMLHEDLRDLID